MKGTGGIRYGGIAAVAEYHNTNRRYVSKIVHGIRDWRKADLHIVRALYAVDWAPPEGRRHLRMYLNKKGGTLLVDTRNPTHPLEKETP